MMMILWQAHTATHLLRSGEKGHCHVGPENATKPSTDEQAASSSGTHVEPCESAFLIFVGQRLSLETII